MKNLTLLFVLLLALCYSSTSFAQGNQKEKAKKEHKQKKYQDDDNKKSKKALKNKKMKKGKKKGGPSIDKRIHAEEHSNGNAYKGSRHNIYDTEDSDAMRRRKISRARKDAGVRDDGKIDEENENIFKKKKREVERKGKDKKDGGIFGRKKKEAEDKEDS